MKRFWILLILLYAIFIAFGTTDCNSSDPEDCRDERIFN